MFRRETRKPFLKVCSSFGFVLGIFVRKYQAFRRVFGIPFCTVETKSHVKNTGGYKMHAGTVSFWWISWAHQFVWFSIHWL